MCPYHFNPVAVAVLTQYVIYLMPRCCLFLGISVSVCVWCPGPLLLRPAQLLRRTKISLCLPLRSGSLGNNSVGNAAHETKVLNYPFLCVGVKKEELHFVLQLAPKHGGI